MRLNTECAYIKNSLCTTNIRTSRICLRFTRRDHLNFSSYFRHVTGQRSVESSVGEIDEINVECPAVFALRHLRHHSRS